MAPVPSPFQTLFPLPLFCLNYSQGSPETSKWSMLHPHLLCAPVALHMGVQLAPKTGHTPNAHSLAETPPHDGLLGWQILKSRVLHGVQEAPGEVPWDVGFSHLSNFPAHPAPVQHAATCFITTGTAQAQLFPAPHRHILPRVSLGL